MSFKIHAIVFQTGTELTLSECCQPFDLNLTTASPSPPLTQLQPPGPPCCSPAVCSPLPGTSYPRFAWLVPSFIQIFSEMWHLREVISDCPHWTEVAIPISPRDSPSFISPKSNVSGETTSCCGIQMWLIWRNATLVAVLKVVTI